VLNEQHVINDGVTVWTYLPEEKEVNIDNFDANADDVVNPSKIFDIYKKGYKYMYLAPTSRKVEYCAKRSTWFLKRKIPSTSRSK